MQTRQDQTQAGRMSRLNTCLCPPQKEPLQALVFESCYRGCSVTCNAAGYKTPNAALQPRPEAAAQRRLEGVGCRQLFGQAVAPSPVRVGLGAPPVSHGRSPGSMLRQDLQERLV